MDDSFLFHFWWLVFPLAWFVFAALWQVLAYLRSRDAMRAMSAWAAQGKEPPAELVRAAQGSSFGDCPPYGWRARRWWWGGPYYMWSRAISFAALAGGFAWAARRGVIPGASGAFEIVAMVMGAIAAGSLLLALTASLTARKA
jgi:hypothetical protein